MECETCGVFFDPIASRWLCPHCHTKTPCCDGAPLPSRGHVGQRLPIHDPDEDNMQPCQAYARPIEETSDGP